MAPRTILHTGTGGAGRTTVAAATARRCAADGARTLLLSTDPERPLGALLDAAPGPEPVAVGPLLSAQQLDVGAELARRAPALRTWHDDLAIASGLGELLGLLAVEAHHADARWDIVVVDCASTGETLRALALCDVARGWLGQLRARSTGAAMLEELGAAGRSLAALGGLLRDRELCSVRLVVVPEAAAMAAARRALTHLGLHGIPVDAVVANRVARADSDGPPGARRARQEEHLGALERDVAPLPVLRAPELDEEVAGAGALERLGAALFPAGADAAAVLHQHAPEELVVGRDGATLRLELPFATRETLSLRRIGGELVVALDGHRRTLPLPPALADYRASGARLDDGALHITFDPPG